MRSDVKSDLDEAAEFKRRFLKAILHPSPPWERERFIDIVDFRIQNIPTLSIPKMRL
jgi:hypothetical protein